MQYVFLAASQADEVAFDDYRKQRMDTLTGYCMGAHLKFEGAQEVIGLAFEPRGSKTVSVDFMCATPPEGGFDQEAREEIEAGLRRDNMWQPERLALTPIDARELPHISSLLEKLIGRVRPDGS